MPARVSDEVIEQVRELWAKNTQASAHAVMREYFKIYGNEKIKERKILEVVSKAKKEAPEKPFPFSEWEAWADLAESPEETYFLLLLSYIKQVECGLPLYKHEAKLGKRLRIGLNGLYPYGQYKLVSLYATRQVINYYLNRPQYTTDLDAFVAFKPWLPHHNWMAYYRYLVALAAEVVPFPEVDPRSNLGKVIDPAAIPEAQWPQGLGPVEYPELDRRLPELDRRLKGALIWLLIPRTPLAPDRESDPQKREMLQLLLQLWGDELETSDSFQVKALLASLLAERYANEEEQQREEQLVRN